MNILVIGGTGFIGQHIIDKLLHGNHHVISVSRATKNPLAATQANLTHTQCDIINASDDQLMALMHDIDSVVYAAGSDERATPEGDAYEFFSERNIAPMVRVLDAAKASAVKSFILLNSIFSYLDRQMPELQLYQHHPYIRSRVDQRNRALTYADSTLSVAVLEIPYVFGTTNQWQRLVDYIRISWPILITRGGTNAVNVKTIANAVNACCSKNFDSGCYAIGDKNLSWQQLVSTLASLMHIKEKPIKVLPTDAFSGLSRLGGFFKSLVGIHSGLNDNHMADLITIEMFFDASIAQKQLGFEAAPLNQALQETIATNPKKSTLHSIYSVVRP